MPPLYSIIIPAYNEADELPQTLSAIREAMQRVNENGECIVVDNHSSDQTAEIARIHGADQVVYEAINQISRARNSGARASTAPYLIFIDADTRIKPELLKLTLEALQTGQCVGGGSVVRFEGQSTTLGRFGVGVWEMISKRVRIAAGSYLYCRRDAFEAVGGFDEKLYASEEVRLSRLLKKWGRNHDMDFRILDQAPVETSDRKLKWYRGPQLLAWVLFMFIAPIAVRSRKLCGFWYQRPNDSKTR